MSIFSDMMGGGGGAMGGGGLSTLLGPMFQQPPAQSSAPAPAASQTPPYYIFQAPAPQVDYGQLFSDMMASMGTGGGGAQTQTSGSPLPLPNTNVNPVLKNDNPVPFKPSGGLTEPDLQSAATSPTTPAEDNTKKKNPQGGMNVGVPT